MVVMITVFPGKHDNSQQRIFHGSLFTGNSPQRLIVNMEPHGYALAAEDSGKSKYVVFYTL